MNTACRNEKDNEEGAEEFARARGLLSDIRKRRSTLELTGHSQRKSLSPLQQEDHPSSPRRLTTKLGALREHDAYKRDPREHSHRRHQLPPPQEDNPLSPTMTTKRLGTVNEHDACEGDRAKDILEQMKKKREHFSKLLVGVTSPTPTKNSVGKTESTADLSWVSSSSSEDEEDEGTPCVYSEEEASNAYDDYAYHSASIDSTSLSSASVCSTSCTSSGGGLSFFSSEGYSTSSSSLLSEISFQKSLLQALDDIRHHDMRYVNIPNALTAKPLSMEKTCPGGQSRVLARRTLETSRARGLYHEEKSKESIQKSIERAKSYHYLKTEHDGPGSVSRLRADLNAISERRAVLTNMLDSVRELKSQEIDFSVVAPTILSANSIRSFEKSCQRLSQLSSQPFSRYVMTDTKQASLPSHIDTPPIHFGGSWNADDAQPEEHIESFGFPLSDLKWAGASDDVSVNSSKEDPVEWNVSEKLEEIVKDDSMRGSMYLSESSTTEASEDSPLPLHIEFKVKHTPLAKALSKPPKSLRSAEYLKALYSPRPEETYQPGKERRYGGIYHIAQLTADVEKLTDRSHVPNRRNLANDDFDIPYNVEDRFCGGHYHIASLTRPASKRALI